ncbi:MAG: DUF1573 domain-containing protein [Bacteroidia bacterium]
MKQFVPDWFYITVLLVCLSTVVCPGQPTISFEKKVQHLGFVHKGDTLVFKYDFTNTGNQPLVISEAKVQCSCTVVKTPQNPVLPGNKGIITATFYTSGTIDRQDRTIIIMSNADNSPVELRFKCVVIKR